MTPYHMAERVLLEALWIELVLRGPFRTAGPYRRTARRRRAFPRRPAVPLDMAQNDLYIYSRLNLGWEESW